MPPERIMLTGKRILLVDDDIVHRDSCQESLERRDAEIIVAENGKEGLHIATEVQFDLVLSDLNMPVMDGAEMINLIREQHTMLRIAFVIMSAADTYDYDEYRNRIAELCQPHRILLKPITLQPLITSVHEALALLENDET